jgi:RND family efflux transporter MFP subunit
MKKHLIGLVIVTMVLASCGGSAKDDKGDLNDKKAKLQELKTKQRDLAVEIDSLERQVARLDPSAGSSAQPKLVAVATIQPTGFAHYVDLQGKIDAYNISYVAPPNGQGGVVTALYVKEGQSVRKGQLLAKLDDQLIRQQIAPLRVQLTAAEDTYKRTKNLWDQGIGTYQNVLTAETQVQTLRKQIGIIQQQAALMNVTAPSSGTLDAVNVRVGEMFTGAGPAGPQMIIVNTGTLKITAEVPENYLGRIGVGDSVVVELPNLGKKFITRINLTGKTINPTNRSFTIEAPLPSDPSFKPNQVAVVKINDYSSGNAITVPLNVLQNDEGGKFVMVAAKEGARLIARKRKVVAGELYGESLEIKSGLQAGDVIVTEGFQDLYEGQVITTSAK